MVGRWSTQTGASDPVERAADATAATAAQPVPFSNTQSQASALRAAIAAARLDKQGERNHAALQLLEQMAELLQTQAAQQARLHAELALLQQRMSASPQSSNGTEGAATNAGSLAVGPRRVPERAQQLQRLVATGATASEADAILAFTDELQLQQIEARYRLLRDRVDDDAGTQTADARDSDRQKRIASASERFRELHALGDTGQQVRDTFGDTAYDRYLYAIDQPNRVRIERVLPGSNAERAGLAPGDVLLSYDRQTVRSLDDVLRAATRGNDGESASIELLRGAERMSITLPRGPLGIQGAGESINPTRVQN